MPPPLRYATVDSDDGFDDTPHVPTPSSSSERTHGEEVKGASKSRPRKRPGYAVSALETKVRSLDKVLQHPHLANPNARRRVLNRGLDSIYDCYMTSKYFKADLKWLDLASDSFETLKALLQESPMAHIKYQKLADLIAAEEARVMFGDRQGFNGAKSFRHDARANAHDGKGDFIPASDLLRRFQPLQVVDPCISQAQIPRPQPGHPQPQKEGNQGQWPSFSTPVNNRYQSYKTPTLEADPATRHYAVAPTHIGGVKTSWPEESNIKLPPSDLPASRKAILPEVSPELATFEQVRKQLRGLQISDPNGWELHGEELENPFGRASSHADVRVEAQRERRDATPNDTKSGPECSWCGLQHISFDEYGNLVAYDHCDEVPGAMADSYEQGNSGIEEQSGTPNSSPVSDAGSVREDCILPRNSVKALQNTLPTKDVANKSALWTADQDEELIALKTRMSAASWAGIALVLHKTRSECKERYKILEIDHVLPNLPQKRKSKMQRKRERRKEERKLGNSRYFKSRFSVSGADESTKSTQQPEDCKSSIDHKLDDHTPVDTGWDDTAVSVWGHESDAGAFRRVRDSRAAPAGDREAAEDASWNGNMNPKSFVDVWGSTAAPVDTADDAWTCTEYSETCEGFFVGCATPKPAQRKLTKKEKKALKQKDNAAQKSPSLFPVIDAAPDPVPQSAPLRDLSLFAGAGNFTRSPSYSPEEENFKKHSNSCTVGGGWDCAYAQGDCEEADARGNYDYPGPSWSFGTKAEEDRCSGWKPLDPNVERPWSTGIYRSSESTPKPATPAPKPYTVTYWATVECYGRKVHIPIDSSNILGPEKDVLDGPAKIVWKWAQEKGLGAKIGLRDAFDLAKDMTVKGEAVQDAQQEEEKWHAPTGYTSPSVSPFSVPPPPQCWPSPSPEHWGGAEGGGGSPSLSPQPWGRRVSPTLAPSLHGKSGGGFGGLMDLCRSNHAFSPRPATASPVYGPDMGMWKGRCT